MKIAIGIVLLIVLVLGAAHGLGNSSQDHFNHVEGHSNQQHSDHGTGHDGGHAFQHLLSHDSGQPAAGEEGPVTVSIAQNDFDLCTDDFYIGFYELTKNAYGIGIDNVTVATLEQESIAYIRAWPDFTPVQAEGWVEHIKDIPAQLVKIIREDPTVLDSCANFSVALVGPP